MTTAPSGPTTPTGTHAPGGVSTGAPGLAAVAGDPAPGGDGRRLAHRDAVLADLADLQAQFLATISLVNPHTPVPWCGEWRVRDLVEHLAEIHRWAAGQAARHPASPAPGPPAARAPLGSLAPENLTDLYASSAAELLETLRSLDPDDRAWTLDDSGVVGFWDRRQTHETLIHLWDLRTAAGLPLDVAPVLWADAVDEVVTVLQPRQEHMGRMAPLTDAVVLEADDADRSWQLGCARPAVVVRGPSQVLALLLWSRTGADDPALVVTGEAAALTAALVAALTP